MQFREVHAVLGGQAELGITPVRSATLEKLQALGVKAMLFTAKPGKKPNTWLSEVLAPRCQLSEYGKICADRMKDLYGVLVRDWVPEDATGQLEEPSSAPVEPPIGPVAPPDPQQTLAPPDPPAAPTGPLMAQPDPPVAVASFYHSATSATSVKSLTRPPAAPTGPSTSGPHSSKGTQQPQFL
ncbi:hypothetical protein N1851_008248 [Merluccius polli]|uniref:Uncharacterized protein n=1 Tax=Merluccius polli TaxID=89951 RepID=A0AA47N2G8_MERPO|nr:hypothetical protein N1851_008248 [Merluccius polli]